MSVIPGQDLIDLYSKYEVYPYNIRKLLNRMRPFFGNEFHRQMLIITKYYSYVDFMKWKKIDIWGTLKFYFPEALAFESTCDLFHDLNNFLMHHDDYSHERTLINILANLNKHNSEIINNLREFMNSCKYNYDSPSYRKLYQLLDYIKV